jgi:hypothetical protein
MRTYEEPSFLEPLNSTFVYAGWSADPVRVGPFMRRSNDRRRKIDEVRGFAAALADQPEIEGVRLFEATFMPPLRGMPKHDVVLLARIQSPGGADKLVHDSELAATEPTRVFTATNAARFGATEDGLAGTNILLNHFVGPSDRAAAVDAWRAISSWYATVLGMDNSLLLRTEGDAPFVIVTCVRLSTAVVRFLLNQLVRPSFHRHVRALLKRHRLTSLPLFVRNVAIASTSA